MEKIDSYLLDMEYIEKHFKENNSFNIGSLDINIYELKVEVKELELMYMPTDMFKPDMYKMYMIKDMKRTNIKINRNLLNKYGFNRLECNWLHQHGWIE